MQSYGGIHTMGASRGHLCDSTAVLSVCLIVDNMPLNVYDNILKIFQVLKRFTPSFIDKFLQDIPN